MYSRHLIELCISVKGTRN